MKNSVKSMVLGLVLAVTAMGFAVAMPLAVRSFTDVTSQHRNSVAETNASPRPIVTPDTSEPEEIILPQRDSEPAPSEVENAGDEAQKKGPTVKPGAPGKAKGPKHKQNRNPRADQGALSRPDRGGAKGPKDPKEAKEPKASKDPKEAKGPKDASGSGEHEAPVDPKPEEGKSTGTSGSGTPGESEERRSEAESSGSGAPSNDDKGKDKEKDKDKD